MNAFFLKKIGGGFIFLFCVVVWGFFCKFYVSPNISDSALSYFHSDGKLSKFCFDIILDLLKNFLHAKQKCHTLVKERNCCYIYEVRKHT